jgi:hypothetical protein
MSAAGQDTVGAQPDDNNFPAPMTRSPLELLMSKTRESHRQSNIFYTTNPPEDESPQIEPAPPSLVQTWFPGVAPNTIWMGVGALAFLMFIKSQNK